MLNLHMDGPGLPPSGARQILLSRDRGVERFLSGWLDVWDEYEVGVEDVIAVPDGRKVTRMDNYEDRAEALADVGLSK